VSAAVVAVMKANKRKDTAPELRVRRALHAQGLRFRKSARISTRSRNVIADVVFTRSKVAVFVDGCFWHSCPIHGVSPRSHPDYWSAKLQRNRDRDRDVDSALRIDGWIPVRIWEHSDAAAATAQVFRAIEESNRAGRAVDE